MNPMNQANNLEKAEDFLKEKQTVSLGTISHDNRPWTSTSPYLVVENTAYIYISSIAEHYPNLKNNPHISLMVVDDVAKAMNPFILKRATFKAEAQELQDIPESLWEQWKARFDPDLLENFRQMGFHMFEIPLKTGRFVTGYGKAFDITWEDGAWKQVAVTGK